MRDNMRLKPILLTDAELSDVLRLVTFRRSNTGIERICRLLAAHAEVETDKLNCACSIVDVSDLVRKCINPRIEKLGLYIACERPSYILGKGHAHPAMLWSFYRDAVANDTYYDGDDELSEDLKNDVADLLNQYPHLKLPDDEWIGSLDKLDGLK